MDKKAEWALVGAAWFLALSVAVLGWLAWRRFAPPDPDAVAKAAWTVASDGTVPCPVTGRRVKAAPGTPHVDYQDHLYYFAPDTDAQGLDARTRFLMDPEKYLHPKAAP